MQATGKDHSMAENIQKRKPDTNVDLFNLFRIILDRGRHLDETKEKAIQYCDEHDVSRNVIMTVAGATGSNIDYNAIGQEKGGRNS